MDRVDLGKVQKSLRKHPAYIIRKLLAWAEAVERFGIRELRKVPGYHDEPLHGDRRGQRSIRLSRAYRAIYVESSSSEIKLIQVIEVSKHEY